LTYRGFSAESLGFKIPRYALAMGQAEGPSRFAKPTSVDA
jgi:hypothetical protein